MTVQLSRNQSAGNLSSQIILHTNDVARRELPIVLTGYIKPLIESQSVVDVGELQQGRSVTKRLLLKASQDFVITDAKSNSDQVKINASNEKKRLHVVDVTVTPDAQGEIADQISITTDLQADPIRVRIVGVVLPAIQTQAQDASGKNR